MVYGTLTRAAAELNVPQSALSQTLLRIEDEVGPLFRREKGRLQPTPLANRIFPEVDRVFSDFDRLRQMTQEIKSGRLAPVRLAVSTPLLLSTVPSLLRRVADQGDNIKIATSVLPIPAVMAAVEDGHADLGLTLLPSSSTSLRTEVVGQSEIVCILATDHELAANDIVTMADLRTRKLVSYTDDNEFGAIIAGAFRRASERYAPDYGVDVSIATVIFVQQTGGVGLVEGNTPWSAFRNVVVRPFRPLIPLPVCVIKSAMRMPTSSQTIIEDHIRSIASGNG